MCLLASSKVRFCVSVRQQWGLQASVFFQPGVWQKKKQTSLNSASVSWQAVLSKHRCFLEQLSCRIFIVWLRFQREITTSVDGTESGSVREGGGGGFPTFPFDPLCLSLINAHICSRRTARCVDGELDFGSFSFNLNNHDKFDRSLLTYIVYFWVEAAHSRSLCITRSLHKLYSDSFRS